MYDFETVIAHTQGAGQGARPHGRPAVAYGRLAYIHCDGQRAVELFEVVTA